ncbi:MAG: hypothetical protein U5N56_08645 [Candidatus Marinimicrobia bacterium]|nr:hypothetical protein [Candidatus Neomarinimicrobiota bacterium]
MFGEAPQDIEFPLPEEGSTFRFAGKDDDRGDYRLIKRNTKYFPGNIRPWVKKLIDEQIKDFTTPHVIWMEGHDSSGPCADTVRILRDIRELMPELDVRHSTLEDYASALKKDFDREKVQHVEGERRSAQYDRRSGNLYGYITSARMYLKQKNTECEKWLERYAEPLNTIAGMMGMEISDRSLEVAWRMLLENSAHDSIGGCSIDSVHEDMVHRYKQVKEIAQRIYEKACLYIISKIHTGGDKQEKLILSVINTTQFDRREIVEAYVDVPEKLDRGSVSILAGDGKELSCEILDVEKCEPVLEQLKDRPMFVSVYRYLYPGCSAVVQRFECD